MAEGVYLARDLVNEPSNFLRPPDYAARIEKLADTGLEIQILGEKEMTKLGMHSLLGVGQGSVAESKIAIMKWNGGKKGAKPLCFVGKGVTFDTGGISLKPGAGMDEMKGDMGGSAAVVGLMITLANRKAKVPDCVKLTPAGIEEIKWMPKTCAYRLVMDGKDLPDWHYLVCGDRERVHETGNSVRGPVVSQDTVFEDDMEDFIVDWEEET